MGARSRSGNRRPPVLGRLGRLLARPPERRARPTKRAGAGDGAKQTAPPAGGSQKCREARPRVAEPAPAACPSGPLWQNSDARQSNSPGGIILLKDTHNITPRSALCEALHGSGARMSAYRQPRRASFVDHRPRRGVLTLAASSSPVQAERLRLGQHQARSGRRAPNRGNVVEDPLRDRIADGGTPGAKGREPPN